MSKNITRLASTVLGGVALLAAGAVPASAANTATTFSVTGGGISVTTQATAALSNRVSGSTTVTGSVGSVTVTDNRGGIVGWTSTASSTGFTRSGGGGASSAVTYSSGAVTKTGTVTAASSGTVTLTATPAPVVVGTLVTGNNTASWSPRLTVAMPAGAITGDYTGTVTTSVA